MTIDTFTVKNKVDTNLRNLYGSNIQSIVIDSINEDASLNTKILGTFYIPFDSRYSFTMVITSTGGMTLFERKPEKNSH